MNEDEPLVNLSWCMIANSMRVARRQGLEVVSPLIELLESNGDLTITPIPTMVDQIDNYYLWKPRDLFAVAESRDRVNHIFLEYLLYHYEQNRSLQERNRYLVTVEVETIAPLATLGGLDRKAFADPPSE